MLSEGRTIEANQHSQERQGAMPTQEERLAALERSFAALHKEVGKSIQEVNENSTILLGLVQTLVQESKQTGLRMEMMKIRMDQLETKFDAHTALLNEHTRVLGEHTKILNEHTATLNEHTIRFDRIETMLVQILARLPE
jgi:N-acyl-D-aspartate/D-glutamate deacylase